MGFFSLIAKLGLDTSSFELGAKRAESATTAMGNKIKKDLKGRLAGLFTVGAIAAWTKHVIDAADNIGDLAEQTGESTDNIQKLQALAGRSGVEVTKYTQGLLKMGEARNAALSGDEKSILLLEKFGLTLADLKGKASNLELLTRVGEVFSKDPGNIKLQADLADLLGAKMAKVGTTIADIQTLGPIAIISEKDIKDISALNDKIEELGRGLVALSAPAAGFAARTLERLGNQSEIGLEKTPLVGGIFSTGRAILSEYLDGGDGSENSGAITKEELDQARAAMKSQKEGMSVSEVLGQKAAFKSALSEQDAARKRLKQAQDREAYSNKPNFDSGAAGGAFYFGNDRTATLGGALKESTDKIGELTAELKISNAKLAKLYQD